MLKEYFTAFSILLIIPAIASANGDDTCLGMMGWGGWSGWSMAIVPIFWIALIGAAILFIAKSYNCKCGQSSHEKSRSAQDILKERYAKGEINKEQFEAMKSDLEK